MNEKILKVLNFIKDYIIILTAFSYFTGAVYLYTYYDEFGLSSTFFSFSIYDILVFSFPVFFYRFYYFIFFAIAILGFYYLFLLISYKFSRIGKYKKDITNKNLFYFIIIIFLIPCYLASKNLAFKRFNELRNGHGKQITFNFKEAYKNTIDLNDKEMFLLGETKENYYVIYQPQAPTPTCKTLPCGFTYEIPKEHILWATVSLNPTKREIPHDQTIF